MFEDRLDIVKQIGAKPTNLFHKFDNRFLIQNGGKKDFCLDNNQYDSDIDYNSFMWSTGVKNYILHKNNKLIFKSLINSVNNQEISLKKVKDDLKTFYKYIEYINNIDISQKTIIDYYINLFKKYKHENYEKSNLEILNDFLVILLFFKNDFVYENNYLDDFNLTKDNSINKFLNFLHIQENNLKPNFELLIRHLSKIYFNIQHI